MLHGNNVTDANIKALTLHSSKSFLGHSYPSVNQSSLIRGYEELNTINSKLLLFLFLFDLATNFLSRCLAHSKVISQVGNDHQFLPQDIKCRTRYGKESWMFLSTTTPRRSSCWGPWLPLVSPSETLFAAL